MLAVKNSLSLALRNSFVSLRWLRNKWSTKSCCRNISTKSSLPAFSNAVSNDELGIWRIKGLFDDTRCKLGRFSGRCNILAFSSRASYSEFLFLQILADYTWLSTEGFDRISRYLVLKIPNIRSSFRQGLLIYLLTVALWVENWSEENGVQIGEFINREWRINDWN